MEYSSVQEIIKDIETNPIESGGHVYHPIPFPEFKHLKTSSNKDEVYKKWDLILSYIKEFASDDLKKISVLDVGANGGFYTFSLAKEGCKVTAFEPHPRYAPIGKFLAREMRLNVEWNANPFNPESIAGRHFSVALMLSVFQWMADGGERMTEACEGLKNISSVCDYMMFELGYNKGKSCIRTSKLNHYAELIRFLKKHTAYRCFKLLGTTELWKGSRRYLLICSNDRRFSDSLFWRLVRIINI